MTAYMAPGFKSVEEIVASQWFTTVEEMHTKKRYMDVAEARQVVMWYAHERRGIRFSWPVRYSARTTQPRSMPVIP